MMEVFYCLVTKGKATGLIYLFSKPAFLNRQGCRSNVASQQSLNRFHECSEYCGVFKFK